MNGEGSACFPVVEAHHGGSTDRAQREALATLGGALLLGGITRALLGSGGGLSFFLWDASVVVATGAAFGRGRAGASAWGAATACLGFGATVVPARARGRRPSPSRARSSCARRCLLLLEPARLEAFPKSRSPPRALAAHAEGVRGDRHAAGGCGGERAARSARACSRGSPPGSRSRGCSPRCSRAIRPSRTRCAARRAQRSRRSLRLRRARARRGVRVRLPPARARRRARRSPPRPVTATAYRDGSAAEPPIPWRCGHRSLPPLPGHRT